MKKQILFTTLLCTMAWYCAAQTTIKMTKEGGVYTVPCQINGLPLRFVFDTGASDVSISLTEANFMYKNGHLALEDIVGTEQYRIANGDLIEGIKINLREVKFGGLTLFNVEASITNNLNAPLLLGQSVISKLGKIQIDGSELTILNGKSNSYDYAQEDTYAQKKSTPNKENYPANADTRDTYSYAPILERPEMGNARTVGLVADNKVVILKKVNQKYYHVKSGNITGYLWAGWLK